MTRAAMRAQEVIGDVDSSRHDGKVEQRALRRSRLFNGRDATGDAPPATTVVGRGIVAGVAGTVAMTTFQKLVEMPLTGRDPSFIPAKMGAAILRVRPRDHRGWVRFNYACHFTIGLAWGLGLSAAGRAGLQGQRRVGGVYAVVWNSDWLGLVALDVDKPPGKWSRRDLIIDVGEKMILAQAANAALERLERGANLSP